MKLLLKIFISLPIQIGLMTSATAQANEICGFGLCIADEVSPNCKETIYSTIEDINNRISDEVRQIYVEQLEELLTVRVSLIKQKQLISLQATDELIYKLTQQAVSKHKIIDGWPSKRYSQTMEAIKLVNDSHQLSISSQNNQALSLLLSDYETKTL